LGWAWRPVRGTKDRLCWVRALGEFLFPNLLQAVRADAVGELNVGMFGYVVFQVLPVILVVADALAVSTNRKEAPELPDLSLGGFEFGHTVSKLVV